MKSIRTLALALAMLVSAGSFAANLICEDGKYRLDIRGSSARLSIDGTYARFGNLKCRGTGIGGSRLFCVSQGTADAGYSAEVRKSRGAVFARLSENTYVGARKLGDLPCRARYRR